MTLRPTGSTVGWANSNLGWRPSPDSLDLANRDIQMALEASQRKSAVQSGRRRCLNAIDECLTRLEELHARGVQIARRDGCRKVVAQLTGVISEEPPEAVQAARNSYDLHSALLNWQSGVLDSLVPGRRERYPDLDLERDEWPRPRRRRRRSPRAGALAAA